MKHAICTLVLIAILTPALAGGVPITDNRPVMPGRGGCSMLPDPQPEFVPWCGPPIYWLHSWAVRLWGIEVAREWKVPNAD